MGKEQRQPSAADLILAAQKRRDQEWLAGATERAAREEKEKGLEKARMQEIQKREETFREIDRMYGLSKALEDINQKVLGKRAEVRTFFKHTYYSGDPYVGWVLRPEKDERVEIMMSFIQTQYTGAARIMSLIVESKSVDILIDRAPRGAIEVALWRRAGPAEKEMIDRSQKVASISFSEPDFQDKFHKALAEAVLKTPYVR